MRVGQRRGHEEFEVRVVRDILLSNLNGVTRPRFDDLHLQNRLKRGVKFLANVFKQDPFTELDTVFEISDQSWMR